MDARFELNRAWWDERVAGHVDSEFYDLKRFREGGSTLRPFELEEVGDVSGKRLAHLQCHFGMDSMSWARAGASVRGLDFSEPAVAVANEIAGELGIDADFVQSDVYDSVAALDGERFDIVYTGLGALNWLPDMERWAAVVDELLKPGGFLYLSEFHPFTWIYGDEIVIEADYFHDPKGVSFGDDAEGSYADLELPTRNNETLEWAHPISEVISVLLGAGLRLDSLSEHDYTLFPRFDHLIANHETLGAGVIYRQPDDQPKMPLMYALRATKPG